MFDFKSTYFFDDKRLDRMISQENRAILSRYGAFVRRTAKGLIKKPRQKLISELSEEEREDYKTRKRIAKEEGKPTPKRPKASSKPGEAPRDVTGLLRRNIFFAFDPVAQSVVVGAVRMKPTNVPEILEYGGASKLPNGKRVNISARPYMRPAHETNLPTLPAMWRNRF